jgi:UDP-glucuronate 4-epimerase
MNLGNNSPVKLHELIAGIETALGKKAIIEQLPEQPGDVRVTFADIRKATELIGYAPQVKLQDGLNEFCAWLNQQ